MLVSIHHSFTFFRYILAASFASLLTFASGSIASQLPVAELKSDQLASPPTQGFNSASDTWVDSHLVSWSRTPDPNATFTYDEANSFCHNKGKNSLIRWELPNQDAAERLYKEAVKNGEIKWHLDSIWVLSDGANKKVANLKKSDDGANKKVANLKESDEKGDGTMSLNVPANQKKHVMCIALPQGFDRVGNYMTGHLVFSKPQVLRDKVGNSIRNLRQRYDGADLDGNEIAYKMSNKICDDMNKNGGSSKGVWKLPAFLQVYNQLFEPLILNESFKKALSEKWEFDKLANVNTMVTLDQSNYTLQTVNLIRNSNPDGYIAICVRQQVVGK